MKYTNRKKVLWLYKYSFFLFLVPIIIGWINNINLSHKVIYLSGAGKTYRIAVYSLAVIFPFIISVIKFKRGKSHWFFKFVGSVFLYFFTLIFFVVFTYQTIVSFETNISLYGVTEERIDFVKVVAKNISVHHGTHYEITGEFDLDKVFDFTVEQERYEKLKVGDSLKIKYLYNPNGSIVVKYGDYLMD